jgi:hypothetical protein
VYIISIDSTPVFNCTPILNSALTTSFLLSLSTTTQNTMCEIYKDFWLGCRAAGRKPDRCYKWREDRFCKKRVDDTCPDTVERSDGRPGICLTHAEKLWTQKREKAEKFNHGSKERWNNGERRLRVTTVNGESARWRGKGAGCDIL